MSAPLSARSTTRVERLVVVVPAHNEQRLLARCLSALDAATTATAIPVEVIVVLDTCTDASASLIPSHMSTIRISARSVGAARRAGFAAADTGDDPAATWLATTDADSEVPPHWLRTQVAAADGGADAYLGIVTTRDWAQWPPHIARRFAQTYRPTDGHRHVHGANLGVRASTYREIGGFADLSRNEDVDLVGRLQHSGARLRWCARAAVITSTRRDARAPGGFAAHLAALDAAGAVDAETEAP